MALKKKALAAAKKTAKKTIIGQIKAKCRKRVLILCDRIIWRFLEKRMTK